MLDVAKDGYYDTELCLEDFENVSWLNLVLNPPQKITQNVHKNNKLSSILGCGHGGRGL